MDILFIHNLLLIFFFFGNTHLSFAADTISLGQSLTGDQILISKEGKFALGFFTPGQSKRYYIGIWYNKIEQPTFVWVANRENPLPGRSSHLKIDDSGNLVLANETGIPVWSTAVAARSSPNSTVAVLQDSGNLVLKNASSMIWQSFDHLTDTWLPTGRVGLNKITGRNQRLTSWKNKEDPAPGPFSLEIDPGGTSQYIIVRNGTGQYWTSGVWDPVTEIFSKVPEMVRNYIYDFSYFSNEEWNYFTYSVRNTSTDTSRFVMDVTGQIKVMSWLENYKYWNLFWSQPRAQCEVTYLCGPFGLCTEKERPCECLQGFRPKFPKEWNLSEWTGGCERKSRLRCDINASSSDHAGGGDRFLRIPVRQLPGNSISAIAGDCESGCLNNCSCRAYAVDSDGKCRWWGEDLNGLRASYDLSSEDLYIRLAASELGEPKRGGAKLSFAIVGAAAGAVCVFAAALLVALVRRHRRKRKILSVSLAALSEGSLVPFSYRDLQIITGNFSEKIGGGAFGSVFKGSLPGSTAVAVKKLEGLTQGEKQFRSEVSTIGTICHLNLIRLRGFCSEGDKRLLVYDFMGNSSLDAHLFGDGDRAPLMSWRIRYQIILGTARGLAYLHDQCRDCIIHCDIKPENILLDSDFCPKVADFGLAKLIGREFSRVLTTMRGTRGYLAPEWISGQPITSKADVFSYGMTLFEVLSGKRNFQKSENGEVVFFPSHAARKVIKGDVRSLVDGRLEIGEADEEELIKVARVACWCIQDDENERPSMSQVVQILEGILQVNIPPMPRFLQVLVNQITACATDASSHTSSLNQSSKTSNSNSDGC